MKRYTATIYIEFESELNLNDMAVWQIIRDWIYRDVEFSGAKNFNLFEDEVSVKELKKND